MTDLSYMCYEEGLLQVLIDIMSKTFLQEDQILNNTQIALSQCLMFIQRLFVSDAYLQSQIHEITKRKGDHQETIDMAEKVIEFEIKLI